MKKLLYFNAFLVMLLLGGPAVGWAQSEFFADAPELRAATKFEKNVAAYRVYRINLNGLKTYLANAPVEFTADGRPAPALRVPMPDGTITTFAIYESPILAPAVAVQYPDIKTYTGQATTPGSTAVIRLSFTGGDFNGIVLGLAGGASAYFEKSTANPADDAYLSYSTLDVRPATGNPVVKKKPCGVQPLPASLRGSGGSPAARPTASGGTLRTLRLAVAATGEFTNAKGTPTTTAAGGYAAVVQYVNRLVAVYRRELSVSFVLVSTAAVVYTDPATDPFLTPTNNASVLPVSQTVLDANVGDANYDIGHTLGYGGTGSGGGLAEGSSVCSAGSKAQGVSDVNEGGPGPFPAIFGDQLFCHEIGHQFGMNHSYNSSIPVCTTRNPGTSVEPGSGTTIMSYGYTCSDATGNDDYETGYLPFLNFHATNLAEATAFIGTISCFTSTSTGNAVPVPGAFTSGRTIPKSTPFVLTGTATDANAGNVLSYSWEGTDTGAAASPGPTVLADPTQAPFFRSYEPAATGTRLFPRLSAILDGTNQAKGDKLPAVDRMVNLRLTVRDNVDGVAEVNSVITIDGNSGPFLITSNLAGSYPGNTAQPVTWSVNNTTAAPVNCANVDILLSVDGGLTFPYTLATATPNDGTELVAMPVLTSPTTTARLKVQASNNIFFDISNADFAVTAPLNTLNTSAVAGAPFCAGVAVSVPYTITGTFAAGNTFVAQLSDASGGFGAPVTIGSVSSSTTSGVIAAIIPAGTITGTGYRIRVVASDPAFAGTDNGANLTITAPQSAGIGYAATSYCTTAPAAAPVVLTTGATAGAFSSTAGLTLDATTGAITPSTSTPGTYTVTNTVAASGACALTTGTATVTIVAPQSAGISYAATSYCTTAPAAAPVVLTTGATAGAFSSTVGLTLDATTGAITPSTSTPGTYTVTNTVAASGGCGPVTGTATVSIVAPQSATFTYPTTPASYCAGTTLALAPTLGPSAAAGVFALTNGTSTGATVNPTTGVVNLSATTAGTFTVTNTLAAAGGCAAVVASQVITVQPLPAVPVLFLTGPNAVSVQGGALPGVLYQFLLNGVAVGPASAVATYQLTGSVGNGQYTVVATSAAGCASAPSAALGTTYLGTASAQASGAMLLVYPNPAPLGGGAVAELRNWTSAPATLTLYDALGRAVLVTPAGTKHLKLTGLAAGVYLLRAQAAGQQASRRLVVE